MSEDNKLPLRRVQLPLSKFNEVAIPHHLQLLKQHRANILKCEQNGDMSRAKAEQTHAHRVLQQLRTLLNDLDSLRSQVKLEDLEKFDKLSAKSTELTMRAISDYLETSPVAISSRYKPEIIPESVTSGDSVIVLASDDDDQVRKLDDDVAQLQLQVDEESSLVNQRASILEGWYSLQREAELVLSAWSHIHNDILAHSQGVDRVATSIDVAADNVADGTKALANTSKIRLAGTILGGAAGALVGGPVGLLGGLKAGGIAAVLGAAIGGFWGTQRLGKKEEIKEE